MTLWTYSQIKTKLYNDLDLSAEDFFTEDEFLGYLNEAIDDAETEIHTLGLGSNYFLTYDTLTLASGTSEYAPPSDIYANKFLKIFYINGSTKYEILRIRNLNRLPFFQSGQDYEYLMVNITGGVKQKFYPEPAENGAYIQRWYLRNVRALTTSTASTNTCEIPEAINFILAHARMRISAKENNGTPNPDTVEWMKTQRNIMVSTLQEMVPDENNTVEMDMTFYEDSVGGFNGNP